MSVTASEIQEIPDLVRRMVENCAGVEALANQLAESGFDWITTIARGSSAHAADYFNYLLLGETGVPGFPADISLLCRNDLSFRSSRFYGIAFSQSGKSPDLVSSLQSVGRSGARTVAIVNTDDSPLGEIADTQILLPAGTERSVAATKSYAAMIMASAQVIAFYTRAQSRRTELLDALTYLPDQLMTNSRFNWQAVLDLLLTADKTMVVGSGAALSIASEAALKFQEMAGIQASAYSAAEARHGPMEVITPQYPLVVFAPRGPEQAKTLNFAREMRARGATVLIAAPEGCADADLICSKTSHPLLDVFPMIASFYAVAEKLGRARGRNPDAPVYLQKVTET